MSSIARLKLVMVRPDVTSGEDWAPTQAWVPTGLAALDAALGGGLPCGQVLEISGGASSGKSTLAFGMCRALLGQGKAVAWIDPSRRWAPLAALEAGLPLELLLVARVADGMSALKAAHLLLSCRGAVAAVVVNLPVGFVPADSNLVKLQRLAAQGQVALVFLTERPAGGPSLGPTVALRLCVHRQWRKTSAVCVIEIARHKRGPNRIAIEEPAHGPDRLRIRSTL
ncbi:MAG TPA: hypothetical protein VH208_07065 [Myxococcaceae bacterium]|nr:hypothetical protein [Myxococcaceae bacterium]